MRALLRGCDKLRRFALYLRRGGLTDVGLGYIGQYSPKDNFPLPHIDVLVDNTANFALFSFMDSFSGYNQIKMAPEDMEKITFVTL